MADQKDIINLALGHLAVAPITATTESSVAAQTAVRIWDMLRKECLRGHNWSFATVVATLTLNTTYGTLTTSGLYAAEYIYAYDYPSNCLALWNVFNESTPKDKRQDNFREVYDSVNAQKVIVTDVLDAIGEYTFNITDASFFDPNFATVLSYRLAADMAKPLTGDAELANSMMNEFNIRMSEAKRASSSENNPNRAKEGNCAYIDARGGTNVTTSYFNPNNPHLNG